MFINFWYAAALSRELGETPLKVRMLGRHFALFRDSKGVAHCVANVCPHRLGSLGQGWVRGDHIACPYHGWEFDGAGHCKRIPSLGADQPSPPGRARIDAYPVQERYGIVFAFLGDLPEGERPPLMPIPEWDDPQWRCTNATFEIRANYRRLVENALDFAHAEFVHFFGRKGADPQYRIDDYALTEHAWGAGAELSFGRPPSGLFRHFRDENVRPRAGSDYHGPASFITRIRLDARMSSYQYVYETPVDAKLTRTFLVNARNFFVSPIFDRISDRRNAKVVLEDIAVVEALEPPLPADSGSADFSVKTDAIQVHYRKSLQRWQTQGWRIDVDRETREDDGRTVHMIPSPGRVESPNRVFGVAPRCAALLLMVASIGTLFAPPSRAAAPDVRGTVPLVTTDGYCRDIQQVLAGTALVAKNTVRPDFESFVKSKPQIAPLETQQFVEHADGGRGIPMLIGCKTKSADHLNAVYGPGSAQGDDYSCREINRRTVLGVWSTLTDAARRAAKWPPHRIMLDADDVGFMGKEFIKPFEFHYTGADGLPHLRAKAQIALWNDWRWKVMPERFRGTHYCRTIAPEYVRAIISGER